jgi:hypothetical protein
MRRLIFTIMMLTWAATSVAKPVSVLDITEQQGEITAHFSLTSATIIAEDGAAPVISPTDQLEARLRIEAPETSKTILPKFSGQVFGDFTLLSQGKTKRLRTDTITTSTSWLIEPYNEGKYQLPPLTIVTTGTDNSSQTITLNLPAITVKNRLEAKTDFDILPMRQPDQELPWRLIGGVSGGIIIILLLIFGLKGKKCPRPLSPKKQALRSLAGLEGSNSEQIGELSIIIRNFLDHNFTLRTMGKTFAEYAPFIKKHPQMLKAEAILDILHALDQSNYSGQKIEDEELDNLIKTSKEWIKQSAEPLRPEENTDTCGRW